MVNVFVFRPLAAIRLRVGAQPFDMGKSYPVEKSQFELAGIHGEANKKGTTWH